MTPDTTQTLCYAAGGVIGTAVKAWSNPKQDFMSRQTVTDLVTGAIVGILYPLFPLVGFPHSATLVQQTAMIAALAWATGDFAQQIIARIGGPLQAALAPPQPPPPKP